MNIVSTRYTRPFEINDNNNRPNLDDRDYRRSSSPFNTQTKSDIKFFKAINLENTVKELKDSIEKLKDSSVTGQMHSLNICITLLNTVSEHKQSIPIDVLNLHINVIEAIININLNDMKYLYFKPEAALKSLKAFDIYLKNHSEELKNDPKAQSTIEKFKILLRHVASNLQNTKYNLNAYEDILVELKKMENK